MQILVYSQDVNGGEFEIWLGNETNSVRIDEFIPAAEKFLMRNFIMKAIAKRSDAAGNPLPPAA